MRPRIRASHPLRALEKELIAYIEELAEYEAGARLHGDPWVNWATQRKWGASYALNRTRRLARETPGMVDWTIHCEGCGLAADPEAAWDWKRTEDGYDLCPKCAKEAS